MSAMDANALAPLVCPRCRGPLVAAADGGALRCRGEQLVFPVRDGVPILLVDEARPLAADEERR